MKKRGKKGLNRIQKINLIIVVLMIIIVSLPVFILPKLIGYVVREQKRQVEFYFYDENCPLNGYVFSGNKLIGKTSNGFFNLTYSSYQANFNTDNLSVFGRLGACFSEASELLFDSYWKAPVLEERYFDGESFFEFETNIQPNNPTKRALLGFIQPEKVSQELEKIPLKNETLRDLSEINKFLNNKITYAKDWDFNKERNYWQTPQETLTIKRGDCEDFSTTFLSLILAHNNSLNCYNVIFSSHVTTFCHIENYYIYYDQQRIELKRQIKQTDEKAKNKLIELKKNYFEHYGIEANKTEVYYAFNDVEFIDFHEREFIDWQLSLNKKSEQTIEGLFANFEKQAVELQEEYPAFEEVELKTQTLTELPTLKGFFTENFFLIFILGIIFFALIVILIRVNAKS